MHTYLNCVPKAVDRPFMIFHTMFKSKIESALNEPRRKRVRNGEEKMLY